MIIFGVSLELSVDEICEETGALSAKRLLKKHPEGGNRTETENVVLTYSCEPPKYVFIGFKQHATKMFIPLPTRCFKCQLYGHTQSVCHGKITCPKCAKGHTFEDCPLNKPVTDGLRDPGNANLKISCRNCGAEHSAAFRGCPVFQ